MHHQPGLAGTVNGQMLTDILWPAADAAGRVLLAGLFLYEGFVKLRGYDMAVQYMAAYGLPAVLLPFAIAAELGGGALIVIGWQTRLAALVLAGFCLLTAAIFHTKLSDTNQVLHFAKDVALAGAFLFVAGRGAGRLSVDAVLAGRREPTGSRPV